MASAPAPVPGPGFTSIAPAPAAVALPAPAPAPAPTFDLAQVGKSAAPAPAPTAQPAPAPADFGSAFGDFRPPEEEKAAAAPAVDITRITPARPKPPEPRAAPAPAPPPLPTVTRGGTPTPAARGTRPDGPTAVSRTTDKAEKPGKAKAKPAAPSHPSRIWVQVLTGGNREGLPAEWRRLTREDPEVFRGKRAYVTPWRNNFRLLTGPFESEAAAQAYLNQLRRAGVDAFMWTSPAGQAVDALPAGR